MREYQEKATLTDTFIEKKPENGIKDITDPGFIEKILGLAGETGETVDKFKKIIRDQNGQLTPEARDDLVLELGDILWYVSNLSNWMGVSLDDVAAKNIEKLKRRYRNNTIHGSGDHR